MICKIDLLRKTPTDLICIIFILNTELYISFKTRSNILLYENTFQFQQFYFFFCQSIEAKFYFPLKSKTEF